MKINGESATVGKQFVESQSEVLASNSSSVAVVTPQPTIARVAAAIACVLLVASHSAVAADDEASRVPEPDGFRMEDYRTPVPATLNGARVVDGEQAEKIWEDKSAVFIDVYPQAPKPAGLPKGTLWRAPKHSSIKGAHWLANVGYGLIPPGVEAYFKKHLRALTGGDKTKTVVFFCLRNCWMSWNAAKRAVEWGHTDVIWFPDGVDAWKEFDLPVENLKPVK